MKIVEGILSNTPAKPHTGLVGMLFSHRRALDASYSLTHSSRVECQSMARALIEALGGTQGEDGQWVVDTASMQPLRSNPADNEVIQRLFRIEERFETERETIGGVFRAAMEDVGTRLKTLDPRIADVALRLDTLASNFAAHIEGSLKRKASDESTIQRLLERNVELEKTVEELAAAVSRMENRAKPGPKPRQA